MNAKNGGTAWPRPHTSGVHRWPHVLPGARAIVYTASLVSGRRNDANIVVQPLPTGAPRIVQSDGYDARYLPSGHLVYIHDRTLFAASFDLDRLELTGQPFPAVEGVITIANNPGEGRSQFAVSNTGTLVYLPGQVGMGGGVPIQWLCRDGKTTPLRPTLAHWSDPQFAPDGPKARRGHQRRPAK